MGPATLVAAAFIGPGTVTACMKAGAGFGTSLLWALLLSGGMTVLLQETAARIGLISQEGLASVMRNTIEKKWLKTLLSWGIFAAILGGNTAYEAGNINGAIFLKGFCMGLKDRPKVIKLTEFLVYLQFPFNDGLHFWCCKST